MSTQNSFLTRFDKTVILVIADGKQKGSLSPIRESFYFTDNLPLLDLYTNIKFCVTILTLVAFI